MPNYVRNKLTFTGKEKTVKKLMEAVKGEDNLFDFNTVIPMPKELDIESSSTLRYSYAANIFLNDNIRTDYFNSLMSFHQRKGEKATDCINRLAKSGIIDMDLGRQAYENQKHYGATDWYDWCISHWGTKWNAMDVSIDDKEATITFDTAWSAPLRVIAQLAKLFPSLIIKHVWADEDCGANTGECEYEDGCLNYEFYPENCSNEAYDLYEICWDCVIDPEYRS